MSRVLLVGEGPLPGPTERHTRFAALRLATFAAALADHDLRVVDCRADDTTLRRAARDVDAVVSAGIYGPTRAALRLAGDRPLWLDLPGDPFADAQAYAWSAPGRVPSTTADALDTFLPALARGDQFSAVSGPSRFALLGALGALGRTVATPPGQELVHVVPVAWAFGGLPEREGETVGTPLRVMLAGSLNTWFDVDTALAGLLRAMDEADVEVDVVGGEVEGHAAEGAARLRAGIAASRHAGRFRLHGWLPEAELAERTAAADVLVCLDRPGYEPEMGSRTRVLFALHQGLRVVATARSEVVRQLAAEGYVREVPVGDAAAVARALLSPWGPLPDRAPVRERYAVPTVTAPLRAWAASPTRSPAVPLADRASPDRRSRLARLLRR